MKIYELLMLGDKKKPLVSGTVDQSGGTYSFYVNRTDTTPSSGGTTITVPVGSNGYFEWNNEQGYNITSLAGMFYASSATATNVILKTIEFGDDAKKLPVLRTDYMFYNQAKLIDVKGFENLTSTNMNRMFTRCSFTTLNVSKFDTSNVINMSYMFSGCSALTSVSGLENWDTSNVLYMNDIFSYCTVLTSVGDLSNWNTSNVISMQGMFYQCYLLTSVGDLSNWDTGNSTTIYSMFRECYLLTSVGDLSNWNTSKVTSMGRMFQGCSALTSVSGLENWDTSKVTRIDYMFDGCSALTYLKLDNWKTSQITTSSYYANFVPNVSALTVDYKHSKWNMAIPAIFTLVSWNDLEA